MQYTGAKLWTASTCYGTEFDTTGRRIRHCFMYFLRATAYAIARICYRLSVRPSVRQTVVS